jgi:hypothetical protein
MDLDAILRRVQKLLAIASDSRGDPNETAAAAAQAEKIMRKFNLDHAEVISANLKRNAAAEMSSVRVKANMKRDEPGRPTLKRPPKWAGFIGFEVAMLHDVQVRFAWDEALGGCVVEFCGVAADVQVAGWLFDYLVGQMIASVRHFGAQHRRDYGCAPDKVANGNYRDGFVTAINRQLAALRKSKASELLQHSAGTALVVAKKQAIEAHFGDFTYGTHKGRGIRDADAYAAGAAAGRKVDVTRRAVSGASASLALPR